MWQEPAKRCRRTTEAGWYAGDAWPEDRHCEPTDCQRREDPKEERSVESAEEIRPICKYFQQGYCMFGDKCWYLHPQHSEEVRQHADESQSPPAGVRFVVRCPSGMQQSRYCRCRPPLHSGPLRLRIVGNIEALGCWENEWDPHEGIDLFWEGDKWTSTVLTVEPLIKIRFCLVSMDEPECHPGVLQGYMREEAHEARRFSWSATHTVWGPPRGSVLEVQLCSSELTRAAPAPLVRQLPRASVTAFAGGAPLPAPLPKGRQQCYTFDAPGGVVLHFCMYLPPRYGSAQGIAGGAGEGDATAGWPLLLFLHSMHGRLDADNSLFYESDTPCRLLLGHPSCPTALRERFIVVSPQCPLDPERGDHAGIWLRNGWYEESTYDEEAEVALAALLEAICSSCHVDRRRICVTGTSMGAYASLELAGRWPGVFAAAAPVAAHYDLDPVDGLVERLTQPQALPLWFFHAENDGMCPYEPIEDLVRKLRTHSQAEVHLTSFTDTWSNQGHCADRVPYWATPRSPGQQALGEELFTWLSRQRGPGRSLRDRLAGSA